MRQEYVESHNDDITEVILALGTPSSTLLFILLVLEVQREPDRERVVQDSDLER